MRRILFLVLFLTAGISILLNVQSASAFECTGKACNDAITACSGTNTVGNGTGALGSGLGLVKDLFGGTSASDAASSATGGAGPYSVNGYKAGMYMTPKTSHDTCKNAYSSCMESQVDKSACTDKDVLALITRCNDGKVDAQGSNGCGVDAAIADHNMVDGGKDYSNNYKNYNDTLSGYKGKCDSLEGGEDASGKKRYERCEAAVTSATQDCYTDELNKTDPLKPGQGRAFVSGTGGTSSQKIDTNSSSFKDCMAKKLSSNQDGCEAAGLKWSGGKCTNPSSSPGTGGTGSTGTPSSSLSTGFVNRDGLKGDAGQCGEAKTNLITCDCNGQQNTQASGSAKADNSKCSGVQVLAQILKIVLFVLTILVGVAAVGGIAYSAILYASAEDNASNTSKAKEYIRNIVIGLFAYGLMVAIIGWLVPGSVIG